MINIDSLCIYYHMGQRFQNIGFIRVSNLHKVNLYISNTQLFGEGKGGMPLKLRVRHVFNRNSFKRPWLGYIQTVYLTHPTLLGEDKFVNIV